VYLLVEKGHGANKRTYWRNAGVAYPCRDGSLNLKLDIHPGITFNIRDPKSNGETEEIDEAVETEEAELEEAKVEETKPQRIRLKR
jgi:hypothetical protein